MAAMGKPPELGKMEHACSVSWSETSKGVAVGYEELKQRQARMWGNGPYQRITETVTDIHQIVVERLAPQVSDRWLDLACGTGAVAERACAAGSRVTGLDLAPVLIETARERARNLGLEIDYVVGDVERLEFADASFDKVSSTCGIMFAPDHEASARELGRVTRPGGQIALANWTPTGGLAKMFKVMAPYQPAPLPSSPFDWGDEGRVHELLGESFELVLESTFRPCVYLRARRTGSSSRRATARRKRWPSHSAIAVRSCIATGSTSSRRTIGRMARSSTHASTCSCSGHVAEPGYQGRTDSVTEKIAHGSTQIAEMMPG
jgi:SAM-dependent methyltransferase